MAPLRVIQVFPIHWHYPPPILLVVAQSSTPPVPLLTIAGPLWGKKHIAPLLTTARPWKGHQACLLLTRTTLFAGLFVPAAALSGMAFHSCPNVSIIIIPHFLLDFMDSTSSYIPCLFPCPLSQPHSLHMKMEAAQPSVMLVSYHIIAQCHNPEDHDIYIINL